MATPDKIDTALALARAFRDAIPEEYRNMTGDEQAHAERTGKVRELMQEHISRLASFWDENFSVPTSQEAHDHLDSFFNKGIAAPDLSDDKAYRALPESMVPPLILRRLVKDEKVPFRVVPTRNAYFEKMKDYVFDI
jgi:hypothetical protein